MTSGLAVRSGLSIDSATDHDYFRFVLNAGSTDGHYLAIGFQQGQGDLDLRLYDSRGTLVRTSAGTGNSEQISLAGLSGGTYYADVSGEPNPNYVLLFRTPDGPNGDWAEPNNTLSAAYDLRQVIGVQVFSGLSLNNPGDIDTYTFQIVGTPDSTSGVGVLFDPTQGDLDLYLYDQNGQQVRSSVTAESVEWVSLEGLTDSTYTVKVVGHTSRVVIPRYVLVLNGPQPDAPADWAEPNDTRTTAEDLHLVEGTRIWSGLSINAPGDSDWFQFQTSDTGREGDSVSIVFNRGPEGANDLSLRLYDAQGNLVDSSETDGYQEQIRLTGQPAGIYYVRVVGASANTTNPNYALVLQTPQTADKDWAEQHAGLTDNDTRSHAYNLRTVDHYVVLKDLSIHPVGDVDWFRFETASTLGADHVIRVDYQQDGAPLKLELYRPGESQSIRSSTTDGSAAVISLEGLTAATYELKVFAAQSNQSNPHYTLTILTAPRLAPDWAEDNDTPDQAYDLRTPGGSVAARSIVSRAGRPVTDLALPVQVSNAINSLLAQGILQPGDLSSDVYGSQNANTYEYIDFDTNIPGFFDVGGIASSNDLIPGGTASFGQMLVNQVLPHSSFAGLGTGPGTNLFQTLAGGFNDVVQGLSGGNVYGSNQLNGALGAANDIFNVVQNSGAYNPFIPQQYQNQPSSGYQPSPIQVPSPYSIPPQVPSPIGGLTLNQFNSISSSNPSNYRPPAQNYFGGYPAPPAYQAPWTQYQVGYPSPYFRRGGSALDPATALAGLSIDTPEDQDWFRFELTEDGQSGESARIDFDASQGELRLELFAAPADPSGASPLRVAEGMGGTREVGLGGLPAGVYYLRVTGAIAGGQYATNPDYTLTISTAPQAAAVADWAESNNDRSSAYDLHEVQGVALVDRALDRLGAGRGLVPVPHGYDRLRGRSCADRLP